MRKNNKESATREVLRALGLFTHLGVSMAVCVILGVLLGRFLDGRLGTAPALLIVGSLLGAGASFKVMYDLVIKRFRE